MVTPAELERLIILAEECAEVQQVVSKIIRFGWESYHPADKRKTTNRKLLEKELGHVAFIAEYMSESKDINAEHIKDMSLLKNLTIGDYLNHQEFSKENKTPKGD